MATTREQLYALVKAGAILTVQFGPDGSSLPPYPVAWVELSEDEKRLDYALCGGPWHRADVVGATAANDAIVLRVVGADEDPRNQNVLTFEYFWQPSQEASLELQRARRDPVPAGAVSYGTV